VLTAGADGVAHLWSSSGALRQVLRHGSAPLTAAALSRNGAFAATADDAGLVRLWNARTGEPLAPLRGHTGRIAALAFSRDSRRLATASADATARLWDVPSGQSRPPLEGHEQGLTTVVFSPNGKLLLTASADGGVRTWDGVTGASRSDFTGHVSVVTQAEFSPDGRWVVTAGPTAAGLWRASDGALQFFIFIRGSSGVRAATFTADDRTIVAGTGNGDVRKYVCRVCGRQPELLAFAEARLRELARQASRAKG
jgi:WD40 repeat protein